MPTGDNQPLARIPPETPKHRAHSYEIQAVNLFEQARSAITHEQYERIKAQLRTLIRDAFDAGRVHHASVFTSPATKPGRATR